MEKQIVILEDLGLQSYQRIWEYQEEVLQQQVDIKRLYHSNPQPENSLPPTAHHLLLVEHPLVYTLGKSGHEENILINEEMRKEKGIEYFKINRGGDITFHGPGQLVGYPIIDLEKFKPDIGWYLRSLEEVIIQTIGEFGIKGERSAGETGVWLEPGIKGKERKICALGVRCSRWITMHGLALNVNTDLSYFDYIVPCGIKDKQVASMNTELGNNVPMAEVKKVLVEKFATVFGASIS